MANRPATDLRRMNESLFITPPIDLLVIDRIAAGGWHPTRSDRARYSVTPADASLAGPLDLPGIKETTDLSSHGPYTRPVEMRDREAMGPAPAGPDESNPLSVRGHRPDVPSASPRCDPNVSADANSTRKLLRLPFSIRVD